MNRYPVAMRIPLRLAFVGLLPFVLHACRGPADASGDANSEAPAPDTGWIALFDGESLDGWTPKIVGHAAGEDPYDTWRVEDGLLTVSYANYGDEFGGRFGHLFHEREFSHYLLRAEYRFVGEQVPGAPGWAWRNSGVMIHGERPDKMGVDQAFPVSIEVQLLGEAADSGIERSNANLCTPGTHVVMDDAIVTQHCTGSTSRTCRGDEWVTVEIEVHGNAWVAHRVDGVEVLRYLHPQLDLADADGARAAELRGGVQLDGGTISIQSESFPIQFRSIELLPLEPGSFE